MRLRNKLGVVARSALELRGCVKSKVESGSSNDVHGMQVDHCKSKVFEILIVDKAQDHGEEHTHTRSWKEVLTGKKKDAECCYDFVA